MDIETTGYTPLKFQLGIVHEFTEDNFRQQLEILREMYEPNPLDTV